MGWTHPTEWLSYFVNVENTGVYSLTAVMASGLSANKSATVTVDGVTVGTFNFADFFGWQSYQNYTISGVTLTEGAHELRINFQTDYININYLDVSVTPG